MAEQIYQKYKSTVNKILNNLPKRQKEVILRRFGLTNNGKGKKETLEKIGNDFGVTRERIRQIEADAFKKLKKEKDDKELKKIYFIFDGYLKKSGGLRKEDIILFDLGGKEYQNYVYFFLSFGGNFYRFPENNNFYSFWAREESAVGKLKKITAEIVNFFNKEKKPIEEKKFYRIEFKSAANKRFLNSCLEITKDIDKSPLGYFGLADWPEIKPKGVKDKAYLTLKKEGKPLHFKEIAKLSKDIAGSREMLPQTVHNELIKDNKFVLVGRGVYALKEWGYEPGTVKDVIATILKEGGGPMDKEQIIKEVLRRRLVKKNTVALNLQDKNYFDRDSKGNYILKEI